MNKIAHYEILGEIGSGGMAVVYKARDLKLGRLVALKVLNEQFRQDHSSLQRFQREARLTATLAHPGICRVYDIVNSDECTFLVMELLEGTSLRQRLHSGPVEFREAMSILSQLLEALASAHQRGVIHRDIKPENVFLLPGGLVKLLDFGLAKPTLEDPSGADPTFLTTPGTIAGTVAYMSPEQVRGEPLETASDLYSTGLLGYELLTGVLPTRRATTALTFTAILSEDPPPPSSVNSQAPAGIDRIIMKALRKNPSLRYNSAETMLEDLRRSVTENEGDRLKETEGDRLVTEAAAAPPARDSFAEDSARMREWYRSTGQARPIGREPECLQIQALLERARSGLGGVLLIEGEPGIGKTRLLNFALEEGARRDCMVLLGRCSELQAAPPFFPFVEMIDNAARSLPRAELRALMEEIGPELSKIAPRLRQLLPDLPPPMELPPGQDRHLIFGSLLEFLARVAGSRTLLLGIEDLHWADEATSHFLQYLSGHLRGRNVLLLGTLRQRGFDRSGPLTEAYRVLFRDRLVTRMVVKPLTRSGVSELLGRLACVAPPPQFVDAVFEVTEGTPLFVEELYYDLVAEGRALDEEGAWRSDLEVSEFKVPEGIRAILNRRLSRLSDPALRVLQLAAVMGRRFEAEAVAQSGEFPRTAVLDALEEGERLQQVQSGSENGDLQFSFSHELIRLTLIESLSLSRRLECHLKAADYLESETGSAQENRARIAHHLLKAGPLADPGRTRRALVKAADEALSRTAFEDAVRFSDQALQCGRPDSAERGEILFRRGLAMTGLNQWASARKSWMEALELLAGHDSKFTAGRICATLASQSIWTGRLQECHAISTRGLSIVEDGPSPIRSRLLAWAGHSLSQGGNLREGSGLTDQAVEMARSTGDDRTIGHVMTHRACEYFYSLQAGAQVTTAHEAVARLSDVPWDRAEALAILQIGLFGSGRLEECRRFGGETAQLASRIGHLGSLWMTQRMQGMCDLLQTGDLERFGDFAMQDRAACEQAGLRWVSESLTWLGLKQFWQGNWEEAGRLFEEAVGREPGDFSEGFDSAHYLAWLAWAGPSSELDKQFERAAAILRDRKPDTVGTWALLLAAVEAGALTGETGLAGSFYDEILRLLASGTQVRFNGGGLVETIAGVAAACAGAWDRSEEHFERAIEKADTIPHRVEQIEVRRWYAWSRTMRGTPDHSNAASHLVAEAGRRADALGMRRHLSRSLARTGLS